MNKAVSAGWLPTLRKTLLDHFEVLHDESQEMSPHWTTSLLLLCCLLQTFFISRLDTYSLDQVTVNSFIRQSIVVLMFAVPLLVLAFTVYYSVLARLQPKTIYSRRSRSFASSLGFSVYKYLYRLHFFLTEPVSSGFILSLILVADQEFRFKEALSPALRICLLVPTSIGLVQSLAYILFVESVLPGDHILSASSRTNTAMINISIRVGIASDALLVYASQKNYSLGILVLLLIIRTLPSLTAIYWNLHHSFFFHPRGRVLSTGFHALFILVTLTYAYAYLSHSLDDPIRSFLIPVLLFGVSLLKIILNFENSVRHRSINPETCTLMDILQVAHSYLSATSSGDPTYRRNIRLLSQIMAFVNKKDDHFENFKFRYGLVGHDLEVSNINFILYLFERLKQREVSNQFSITLYQAYYLKKLNFSVFTMSILLGKLTAYQKSFIQQVTLSRLRRLLERRFEEIYNDRQPFGRRDFHFYKADYREPNLPASSTNWTEEGLKSFDIFGCLKTIALFEKMISQMGVTVGICLILYDKISGAGANSAEIHRLAQRIFYKRKKTDRLFLQIEESSRAGEQRSVLHVLPYSLFILIIENDRTKLVKLLKVYRERSYIISRRAYQRLREGSLITNLDVESMVCLLVACMQVGIGSITYVTKNSEGILGIPPKTLEKRNISHFMSDSFQPIHLGLLYSFVRQHDKIYLGIERERYLRVTEDNVYTRCGVVVKLSPVIHEEINFLTLISNEQSPDSFLVLNSNRRVIGFSRKLKDSFPLVERLRNKRLSLLSKELDEQYVTAICHQLSNRPFDRKEALFLELDGLGIDFQEYLKHSCRKGDHERPGSPENKGAYVEEVVFNLTPEMEGNRMVFNGGTSFEFITTNSAPGVVYFEAILRLNIDQHTLSPLQKAIEEEDTASLSSHKPVKPSTSIKIYSLPDLERKRELLRRIGKGKQPNSSQLAKLTTTGNMRAFTMQEKLRTIKNTQSGQDNLWSTGNQTSVSVDLENEKDKFNPSPLEAEKESSAPESFSVRNKVQVVINRRSRTYFYKELLVILTVQVLVWSLGAYMTQLMQSSFGDQMATLIELRKGLNMQSVINVQTWGTILATYDYVLERRGYLNPDRYQPYLPYYKKNLITEMLSSYYAALEKFKEFQAHVYKFPWSLASRYLQNTATYTLRASPDSSILLTRSYDYMDYYRTALWSMRMWGRSFNAEDLNNTYSLQVLTEVIGPNVLDKIRRGTIALLMDTDSQTYIDLTSSVRNIVLSAVLGSLIIANTLILIVYLINKKLVYAYSSFGKLYSFEITAHKLNLLELETLLALSVTGSPDFLQKTRQRLARKPNISDYSSSNRSRTSTGAGRVRKSFLSGCFGMVFFVLGAFTLMELFNTTAYMVLQKAVSQSNKKLDAMALSRATLSGNSFVTMVIYRTYQTVIMKTGVGLGFMNTTDYQKTTMEIMGEMNQLFRNLDSFAASEVRLMGMDESIGFEELNREDSCRYFNLTQYSITYLDCQELGDKSMSRNPLEVYRWMRLTCENIVSMLDSANTSAEYWRVLSSQEMLVAQLIRRGFTISFVDQFNSQLYSRILEFHKNTEYMINTLLRMYLIVSIVVSVLLNVAGVFYVRRQVMICVSSLLLLPAESQNRNPSISALVNNLYKY